MPNKNICQIKFFGAYWAHPLYVVIFIYNRVCKSNFKIESKHIEVAEDVKAPVDDGHDSGLEYEDSTTRAYFEKLENYPRSDILRQKFVVDAFEEVREN